MPLCDTTHIAQHNNIITYHHIESSCPQEVIYEPVYLHVGENSLPPRLHLSRSLQYFLVKVKVSFLECLGQVAVREAEGSVKDEVALQSGGGGEAEQLKSFLYTTDGGDVDITELGFVFADDLKVLFPIEETVERF